MAIFQLADGRQVEVPDSVPRNEAISGLRAKFGAPDAPIQTQAPAQTQPLTLADRITQSLSAQSPPQEPDPVQVAAQQRQQIAEAFTSRETARAAGGVLGGALGIPAGPPGVVAGGALGAAGGDAVFNIIESAKKAFEGFEAAPVSVESAIEAFKSPIRAGTEDIIATLGLGAAGRAARGVVPLVGKAIGVAKQEAKELAGLATKLGVPLGAINVTPREAVKGFAKVAGVFPFIGTPIREAQQSAQKALDLSLDRTLNQVAPTASLQEVGVDLTNAGQNRFKAFRRLSGSLYDDFLKKAENATVPDIFPSTNLKNTAKEITKLQQTQEVILETGAAARKPGSDILANFIEDAAQLPERMRAQQVRGLQTSLQEIMSKAAADGFDVSRGVQLKKALELDFNNPMVDLLNQKEGQELVNSLTTANKFFADNIKDFQTATAKKFGRVDKNIFKPKFFSPGSKEADEAFSAVFNTKSPQALQNLRGIVGKPTFNKAVRRHLDGVIEKTVIEPATEGAARIFDADKLEELLGLGTESGRETLKTMLKDSRITVKQLEDFTRVAKAVGSVEIPNVSTFIQRRAVLGGGKAAAGAFTAGLGVASPFTTIALIAALRKGARVLSDPAQLRSLTIGLDSTATQKAQRAAVLRLIRNIPNAEDRNALTAEIKKENN